MTTATQEPIETEESNLKDTLFIHFKFHMNDISQQAMRLEFETHLAKMIRNDLGVTKMTIAYSRPLNIRNYITRAKLHQPPGKIASKIFGEFKSGLDRR